MFFKKKAYDLTLNRIYDTVRVREGDASITLNINADPMRLVAALNSAQKTLKGVGDASSEAEKHDAARTFAAAMFGPEQADQLLEFYGGDATCVINICGKYFAQRLIKKITKAQKRS